MSIYEVRYVEYGTEYIPFRMNPKKVYVKPDEHVMNKNEAKLMRRLQAQTGLSQEEIREIKKYKKMLSEAQDKGEKPKFVEE
jgi:Zn-dependent M16 (insulinase) family peptidase